MTEEAISEEARADGGAAFPGGDMIGGPAYDSGMTLRDWFASQALIGMAQVIASASPAAVNSAAIHDGFQGTFAEYAAYRAYALADAMLAERAK